MTDDKARRSGLTPKSTKFSNPSATNEKLATLGVQNTRVLAACYLFDAEHSKSKIQKKTTTVSERQKKFISLYPRPFPVVLVLMRCNARDGEVRGKRKEKKGWMAAGTIVQRDHRLATAAFSLPLDCHGHIQCQSPTAAGA